MGFYSKEQSERFQQDYKEMERRNQGHNNNKKKCRNATCTTTANQENLVIFKVYKYF